jgi:hypothetical protein
MLFFSFRFFFCLFLFGKGADLLLLLFLLYLFGVYFGDYKPSYSSPKSSTLGVGFMKLVTFSSLTSGISLRLAGSY